MTDNRTAWQLLLADLQLRSTRAEAMGEPTGWPASGRAAASMRGSGLPGLCDPDSFSEYGKLAGGNHRGASRPWPATA